MSNRSNDAPAMNGMIGSSILLLAPHPDDEVVGCCAAIGRAQAHGSSVTVAFLTTGVPARERLWPWQRAGHAPMVERRRAEARRVCAGLGVEIAHISDIATRHLKDDVPAAREGIARLCAERKVDTLWVPAYEGGHPDHDIANFIASTLRERISVWEFSEYNFCGGAVRSNEFLARTGDEVKLQLSVEEQQRKRAFLEMYESERGNLTYIGAGREIFRPLASYDYTRPPHPGTLFYRRFAWAAFHPRVNEVRPEEVSRAIAGYQPRA